MNENIKKVIIERSVLSVLYNLIEEQELPVSLCTGNTIDSEHGDLIEVLMIASDGYNLDESTVVEEAVNLKFDIV